MKEKILLLSLFLIAIQPISFCQKVSELTERAKNQLKEGKYDAALKDCDIILKKFPESPAILDLKGEIYLSMGNGDAACACFVDGIELKSKNSENLFINNCKKYSPKLDLERFKSGKFVYINEESQTTVVRILNIQTEYFKGDKTYIKSEINWGNNNEYELTVLETNEPGLAHLKYGDIVKCKILKTAQDTYVYLIEFNGAVIFGRHRKIE